MKFQILAAALLLGSSSVAFAADPGMPMEMPPVAYDWSGAYLGVFGGWAHNRTKATDITGEEYGNSTPGATMTLTDDGFVGGITAGFNFQNASWVYGPEVELGWASNDKLLVENGDDGLYTKYGFYGTFAGRIGYAADRTLFYAKGGLALAKIDSAGGEWDGPETDESGFDTNEAGVGDKLRTGWTIGAGVEHAIIDRWSIKAEYMFADFGSKSYDTPDNTDEPFKFRDQLHTLKFGLNYQF